MSKVLDGRIALITGAWSNGQASAAMPLPVRP